MYSNDSVSSLERSTLLNNTNTIRKKHNSIFGTFGPTLPNIT